MEPCVEGCINDTSNIVKKATYYADPEGFSTWHYHLKLKTRVQLQAQVVASER